MNYSRILNGIIPNHTSNCNTKNVVSLPAFPSFP